MNRILLIEDNEIILMTLKMILTREGYQIETANNGRDGFNKLDNERYDLLITDIMMPFASGFEVISKFNQLKSNYTIPIIVISSLTQEDTILDSFKLGVDDFIRKPIMMGELLFKVKKLLVKKNNHEASSFHSE